jgi:hypothetical protein
MNLRKEFGSFCISKTALIIFKISVLVHIVDIGPYPILV